MSHWDGSFEYTQNMFKMKNKQIEFLICTLLDACGFIVWMEISVDPDQLASPA